MGDCKKQYDCKQLLLDCGLSRRRAEQLSSSLSAAIKRQDGKTNETCTCEEKPKLAAKEIKDKDVNEIVNLRRKDNKEI